MKLILVGLFLTILSYVAAATGIKSLQDVVYKPESGQKDRNLLDVYMPNDGGMHPVLMFIHGGSWNSGKKDTYRFLGKGFARKGIVTVVINYRLSPGANYRDMMQDCVAALGWISSNISQYGGDPKSVFVSGHSAGGHLASLLANDTTFRGDTTLRYSIKGCILIDAFGLDMASYFPTSTYKADSSFKITFTHHPDVWKKASPYYHLNASTLPHLQMIGAKTYSSIKAQNEAYVDRLRRESVYSEFTVVKGKGHIGMILQFYWKRNKQYAPIVRFMEKHKSK